LKLLNLILLILHPQNALPIIVKRD
jgi:hypothetical protein